MRHQARFATGLLISAALHAAVLGKYWSSEWFVQTPEAKTEVFRVKVLQPETPAPLKTASVMSAVAQTPKQKPVPPKPRETIQPKRKKPPQKARRKKPKPKPAAKAVRKEVAFSPRRTEPQKQPDQQKLAQASAVQQVASAGRIATIEDRYRALVRQEIEKRKFYPARARRQRRQGTVTVGFELAPDGRISNLRLVKKCKSAVLGRAALEAVRKVGRFPPFPAEIQRVSWAFDIPLSYRIK